MNQPIEAGNSLPTPAKKYLHCLIKSTERLHTRTTILEREKEDLKVVISNKKFRLSGKRKAIEGKHLLADAKTLLDIQKAEERTRQHERR